MGSLLILSLLLAGAEDEVKVAQTPVEGSDIPINTVEGLIDSPPAAVWSVVSHCANYSKTMPRIVKSAELSREGDEAKVSTVKCQVTAHLPFPLPDLTGITQATHTVGADGSYRREWTLVSGDYDLNTGSWKIEPRDEGKKSYVVYTLRVKPKIHLPMSLISSAQKSALKEVIVRVREAAKAVK